MSNFSSKTKYVEARPRREKKLGRGGSVVSGATSDGGSGVSKSYVDSNFVTLATEQTIPGAKDFVGGIKVNGMPITYNVELGVWEFTGDLFVTGNFAWGSSIDGFKPSTVMDAVRVDGSTIIKKKDSNGDWYLYAPGGGSGGSGGGLTLGDVVSYLRDNDYTTKTDVNSLITSSLAGYATEQWVANKGYLTSSALVGYATQSWVGDNYLAKSGGTVSGSFRAFEVKRTDEIGSFVAFSNNAGYMGSLGFRDTDKPGFFDSAGSAYFLIHSDNIDEYKAGDSDKLGGVYYYQYARIRQNEAINADDTADELSGGKLYGGSNWPYAYYAFITSGAGNYKMQFNGYANELKYRAGDESGLSNKNWRTVAFTDSNVASATKLQTPRTIWGQGFDGTQDLNKSLIIGNTQSSLLPAWQEYIGICATGTGLSGWVAEFGNGTKGILLGCRGNNYDIPSIGTVSATDIAIAPDGGNVAIGGTETGSCKLRITTTRSDTFSWVLGDLASKSDFALEFNYNDVYRYGLYSAINYFSGDVGLQVGRSDGLTLSYNLYLQPLGGNVAVGGTAADASLHVHGTTILGGDTTINGNLLVNGNVSWFSHSQRSLKNIVSEQGLSLAQLGRIKPIKFYWKDGRDMALHVGGVADVFAEVLPEVVTRNLQDILCLNYVDAAFYVGASLIAPVLDHERRITRGEAEQEALKKENAKLKRELEAFKSKLNQLVA